MKRSRPSFLLFLLLFFPLLSYGIEYGLRITSYPEPYSKFTEVELNQGKPYSFKGRTIDISFETYLRPENPIGQLMSLHGNDGINIYIIYSIQPSDLHYPSVVIGNKIYSIETNAEEDVWTPVGFSINPAEATAVFTYGKEKLTIENEALASLNQVQIGFGKTNYKRTKSVDIASVNIRGVKVQVGGKLRNSWMLALNADTICYDEISRTPAIVRNGKWLTDELRQWKPLYRHTFPNMVSTAYNPLNNTFFFVGDNKDSNKVYTFDAKTLKADSISVLGGTMVASSPNQLVFLPDKLELLSYNLDENLYSTFDFNTKRWEDAPAPTQDHNFWHNSNNYDEKTARMYSFGGYGHYLINNTLIITDLENRTQEKLVVEGLDPKRMHSSALVGDTLYIFGGQTNETGRQELTFTNDNRLFALDLKDMGVTEIWEMPLVDEPYYTFAENMIYNPDSHSFYTLGTYNQGILTEINPGKDEIIDLSEPIETNITGQYTYLNLFLSKELGKFLAVVCVSDVNNRTTVSVYSLPYPARTKAQWDLAIASIDASKQTPKRSPIIFIILAGALVLGVLGYFGFKRLRATKAKTAEQEETPQIVEDSIQLSDLPTTEHSTADADYKRSAIRFLGGFRVFDRNGEDITSSFPPVLKSLLILLIVKTVNDPKGISSSHMIQLLWSDKSDESAKNNRNVNMSKLRTLLEEVGDISITSQNRTFWRIEFGQDTKCDYCDAVKLFSEATTEENVEKLLGILLLGAMLPNTEFEWLDGYKTQFSDKTIDLLSALLESSTITDNTKLRIADTLFLHDYLSESALKAKCAILYRQGKKGLSKNVYDSFCRNFEASFGTPYSKTLKSILHQ